MIARCRDGSGIIHTFGSSFGAPAGSLVSVSDANTGLTQPIQVPLDNLLNTDPVWLDSYFPKDLAYGQLDTADSRVVKKLGPRKVPRPKSEHPSA